LDIRIVRKEVRHVWTNRKVGVGRHQGRPALKGLERRGVTASTPLRLAFLFNQGGKEAQAQMGYSKVPLAVLTGAAKKAGEEDRRIFESVRGGGLEYRQLRKLAEGLADQCPRVRCSRTREAYVRGFALD